MPLRTLHSAQACVSELALPAPQVCAWWLLCRGPRNQLADDAYISVEDFFFFFNLSSYFIQISLVFTYNLFFLAQDPIYLVIMSSFF